MNRIASPLTIGACALVLVLGLFVGFRLLTASAETAASVPTCEDRTLAVDERVTSNLVKVDVFNASRRAGLANRVSINLQRRNFLAGEVGNSTSAVEPDRVAILTTDPKDARVRLVARQFGDVDYVEPDISVGDAVVVIVGDDYEGLREDASTATRTAEPITVCVPVVPAS